MKNALLVAMELNALLPEETPATTEGYEGFYHLDRMSGNVAEATLGYILRDHDRQRFERRKEVMRDAVAAVNRRFGEGTAVLELSDTYYNMEEKIRPHFYLVERARAAMEKLGVTPVVTPVRGGTDGLHPLLPGPARPNLGTGATRSTARGSTSPQRTWSCAWRFCWASWTNSRAPDFLGRPRQSQERAVPGARRRGGAQSGHGPAPAGYGV